MEYRQTPCETAAYHADILVAREAALITAVTLETRPGSICVRDHAAVETLRASSKVSMPWFSAASRTL